MVSFSSTLNGTAYAGLAYGFTYAIQNRASSIAGNYIPAEFLQFSPAYSSIASITQRIYFEGIKYIASIDNKNRLKNVTAHVIASGCAALTLYYTQQHFVTTWELSPLSLEQALTAATIALLAKTIFFVAKSIFERINFVAVFSGAAQAGVALGIGSLCQIKQILFVLGKYVPAQHFYFSPAYTAIASISHQVFFKGIQTITSFDVESRWKNGLAHAISAGCATMTLLSTQSYVAPYLNLSPLSTEQAIVATTLALLAVKVFSSIKYILTPREVLFREELDLLKERNQKLSEKMKDLELESDQVEQAFKTELVEIKAILEDLFSILNQGVLNIEHYLESSGPIDEESGKKLAKLKVDTERYITCIRNLINGSGNQKDFEETLKLHSKIILLPDDQEKLMAPYEKMKKYLEKDYLKKIVANNAEQEKVAAELTNLIKEIDDVEKRLREGGYLRYYYP